MDPVIVVFNCKIKLTSNGSGPYEVFNLLNPEHVGLIFMYAKVSCNAVH